MGTKREWWQRGMSTYFKERRDPRKLREGMAKRVKELREKGAKFAKHFRADVEKIKEKLS